MKENCCKYQERMQTVEKTIGQMILSLPCLTLERALVLNQLKVEVAEKRWR